MKTVIYYFTGTGNSLAVARNLASALGDCEMVSIASERNALSVRLSAERVGIVCPVYFLGLPAVVAAFAQHLELNPMQYVFGVVTLGGMGAAPALRQLEDILKAHAGRGLDAGFGVKMPGNYILMYNGPTEQKRDRILSDADANIAEIVKRISHNEKSKLPRSMILQFLHNLIYVKKISRIHEADRQFTVSECCTSCGTCSTVCPANNIEIVDGKPSWKHQCELCCGCIHICPVDAIQAGRGTANRKRYRHPVVTIADLRQDRKP